MSEAEDLRTRPPVIGGEEPLDEEAILAGAHRGLGMLRRLRVSRGRLRSADASMRLVHHPMWLAKVVSYADRPPFPAKAKPNVVFVDAVSGYRGVLETMPALTKLVPAGHDTPEPVVASEPDARRYVAAVLRRVDRSYLLKKPRHVIRDLTIAFLPLWHVRVDLDGGIECVVNGNTGEPETYMASLWGSREWLDVDLAG